MNDYAILKRQFFEISLEIKVFIEKSELIYVAESSGVIEGGAYKWVELSGDNKKIQEDLCTRYELLIHSIDTQAFEDSVLKRFVCSWERVIGFLKHDSIVLQDTTDQVCEDIKEEFRLQLWLSKNI